MEEIDICKNGHITSYNPQYPQILTPYHIPFDPMARYQEATKSGVGPDSLVQVAAQCNIIYIYLESSSLSWGIRQLIHPKTPTFGG